MTRKDYELLGAALLDARPVVTGIETWVACVRAIANALERDNPRFDSLRFLKAAGFGFDKEPKR